MKDYRIILCEVEAVIRKAVVYRVFAKGWEVGRVLMLALDA